MVALAAPATAQDNIPRDPIQAEQERRIQGHGFEQSVRQNPQLYPYLPTAPSVATPTPPSAKLSQPPPGPTPPIPPQTHVRPHTQLIPPAISPLLPPEELPPHE